jgi:hypothetical protein
MLSAPGLTACEALADRSYVLAPALSGDSLGGQFGGFFGWVAAERAATVVAQGPVVSARPSSTFGNAAAYVDRRVALIACTSSNINVKSVLDFAPNAVSCAFPIVSPRLCTSSGMSRPDFSAPRSGTPLAQHRNRRFGCAGTQKPPNPLRHIRVQPINLSVALRDRQRRRIRCGVFALSSEPHT